MELYGTDTLVEEGTILPGYDSIESLSKMLTESYINEIKILEAVIEHNNNISLLEAEGDDTEEKKESLNSLNVFIRDNTLESFIKYV